jgi:hypothetical protein
MVELLAVRWIWGVLMRQKPPPVRRKTRRRRLLEASQWRARGINIRDHVRRIEKVIDRRTKQ